MMIICYSVLELFSDIFFRYHISDTSVITMFIIGMIFLAHLSRRLHGSLYYRQAPSSIRLSVVCSSVHNFK